MKILMSVAIAVAFTVLVVPVMADVSAEAQDQDSAVALAESIQNAGIQAVALVPPGVDIEDILEDLDPTPELVFRLPCREGSTLCSILIPSLEEVGFECTTGPSGGTICVDFPS